jgi:phage nucleotide-binding protein
MSLIKKPHELNPRSVFKVLIYGQPKIGKTTLACSAPSPLLLDFDNGVGRVRDEHRIDTLPISSWQDVIDTLKEDLSAYQTLIIDTAGQMLDYMSAYLINDDDRLAQKNGALTQRGYGARKVMFRDFIQQVRMMGKHLIFVAHETEEKEDDVTKKRPEIGGSSRGDLIRELDLVGYMQATGSERTVSFNPTEKYYAGNTCDLDATIKIGDCGSKANNFFTRVFEIQEQKNKERAERLGRYAELVESLKSLVDEIKDIKGVNDFVEGIDKIDHIFDSRIKAGIMVRDKANSLGLSFNKETKKYEEVKHVKAA